MSEFTTQTFTPNILTLMSIATALLSSSQLRLTFVVSWAKGGACPLSNIIPFLVTRHVSENLVRLGEQKWKDDNHIDEHKIAIHSFIEGPSSGSVNKIRGEVASCTDTGKSWTTGGFSIFKYI